MEIAPSNDTERQGRGKGFSCVWNYTEKLSKRRVRCNLCKLEMSFHGTTNLITHLERTHKLSHKMLAVRRPKTKKQNTTELPTPISKPRKNRSIASKYFKRETAETVLCTICRKEFSNKTTSNLTRHLQSMHGVEIHKKMYDDCENSATNEDYIDEFCTNVDEDQVQCKLCQEVFSKTEKLGIRLHLETNHRVKPKSPLREDESATKDTETESEDGFISEYVKKNNSDSQLIAMDELNIKQDIDLYNEGTFYDESQDTNMLEQQIELPQSNPLSPRSSPDPMISAKESRSAALDTNEILQKLNQERLKAETEYFREKAAFYRMQKYLTALQAKKIRAELDELNRKQSQRVIP